MVGDLTLSPKCTVLEIWLHLLHGYSISTGPLGTQRRPQPLPPVQSFSSGAGAGAGVWRAV